MPSKFGILIDGSNPDLPEQEVTFFHDSADCLPGKEHDWSGWNEEFDYCDHEGEHGKDNPLCKGPSMGEKVCVNCGMGAMHHSLMTAE